MMRLFSVIVFLVATSDLAVAAKLPTEDEVKGVMVVCGGGQSRSYSGDIAAKIDVWKRGASGAGTVKMDDLSAVLSTVPQGQQINEANYKQYTSCILDLMKKYISQQDDRTYQLSIQSNDLFIDNREIGAVRARSSTIGFEIDGENVASMNLNQDFPGITTTLNAGQHVFTYRVDIRTDSLRIKSSCSVPINLKSAQTLAPRIAFAPYDEGRGRISGCWLKPIS
ncbi:hypothetical protein ACQ86E_29705 [Bradyrhizobium betae]|uniref:hypothetical protein n=1 Tax=Bradyrhizobium betae TaxID=244734 RepID=UPI003D66CD1F